MASIKIDKDTMLSLLDDNNIIEDTIVGHDRWTVSHQIIFEYDGKYYRAFYRVGATEYQDEAPWEYEKEVECWPVRKVRKQIEVWEAVK